MQPRMLLDPTISLISRPEFIPVPHYPFTQQPGVQGGEALVEFAGRICYMSFGEGEIDGHKTIRGRTSNQQYLANILEKQDGSVLEHANYSVLFEGVSRTFSHELVRHRAGFAYSQLSQRFVDESNVAFVVPIAIQDLGSDSTALRVLRDHCARSLEDYNMLLEQLDKGGGDTLSQKRQREAARAVLPNCTETKIVVTANARAWRHFMNMRGSVSADLEINRAARMVYAHLDREIPSILQDVTTVYGYPDYLQFKHPKV